MSEQRQDDIERRELLRVIANLVDKNAPVRSLGLALMNAELACQITQALLALLVGRGVFQKGEVEGAIAHAFRQRRESLERDGAVQPTNSSLVVPH